MASLLHRTLPWRVPGLEPLRLRPTLTPGRMRATAVVAHSSISMREEVLASSDEHTRTRRVGGLPTEFTFPNETFRHTSRGVVSCLAALKIARGEQSTLTPTPLERVAMALLRFDEDGVIGNGADKFQDQRWREGLLGRLPGVLASERVRR